MQSKRWHNVCDKVDYPRTESPWQSRLTISSKNYGAWALRGWPYCRWPALPGLESPRS